MVTNMNLKGKFSNQLLSCQGEDFVTDEKVFVFKITKVVYRRKPQALVSYICLLSTSLFMDRRR